MPEPITVLPSLYQFSIPTPFPVGPVNVYVARDADGLTLVDCGPRTPAARAALEAGLVALGYSLYDVRRIVVTHSHSDHYGLAGTLVTDAPASLQVFTHPFNRPTLEAYTDDRDRRLAFYDSLMAAAGVPDETVAAINRMRRSIGDYASAVPVTGELNDGDTLTLASREWQVLHTPGHSTGLICLYEPHSHVLLSNDHLLRDISSNPFVEPPPPGHAEKWKSLVEYLCQLQRVAAMDISAAWAGHGGPIHDVADLVRQRVEFHARRADYILDLLDGNTMTLYQVARLLFPRLDPMNFFLALSEVLGHLELLEAKGRIGQFTPDGVLAWQSL